MAENFQTTFSINDQMSSPLSKINKQLEKLDSLTGNLQTGLDTLDDSSFKDLNSSLNSLNNDLGQVDKAAGGVKQALDNVSGDSFNRAGRDVSSLSDGLKDTGSKADSARSSLGSIDGVSFSGVRNEEDKVSSGLNDIDSKAGKAASALNELGNADITPEGFDDLTGQLDVLKQSLDVGNLLNFTDVAGSAVSMVSELGSSAMDAAESYTDSLNSIKMGLGVTGEEAQRFQEIARNVFTSGFGDSIGGITDQLVYMKQLFGTMLSDSELEELLPVFMSLDDQGMDFNETLRGVKNLMIGFGVDAKTATGYMTKGFQDGLNFSDELGDNLSEYAGRWAEMRVPLGNYMSLLKAGTESGAYNLDRVGDFLNEFITSISDGRLESNMDMFSGKTQEVFYNFKAGQGTAQDVLNAVIGDMKTMTSETDRAALSSTLWSSLGEDNAMGMIMALEGVTDKYGDVSQAGEELANSNTNSVTQLRNMWSDFKNSTLAGVGEAFASTALKIIEFMQPVFDFFQNHQGILTTIKTLLLGITAAAGTFMVLTGIPAILGAVSAAAGVLTGALGSLWAVMLANPITTVIAIIAGLAAAFAYAWNHSETFRNVVTQAWEAIKGTFISGWEKIKGIFDLLGECWDEAVATVKDSWSQICSVASSWYNDAVNWGSNVVQGFKDGLISKWDSVKNWVSEKFNWVADHVKGIFQIGSPSKVFEGYGSDILLGFKGGLETTWGTVTGWFSSAWESLKSTAKDWGSKISGFFGFGGDTEEQQLTAQPGIDYTDTINKVKEQMEVLRQSVNAAFAQITQQAYTSAMAMSMQTIAVYQNLGMQIAAQTGVTAQTVNEQFLLIDLSPLGAKLSGEMALVLANLSALTLQFITTLNVQIQEALTPMITTFSEMFTRIISNTITSLNELSTQMIQRLSELSTLSITTIGTMSAGILSNIKLMVQEIITQLTVLSGTSMLILTNMTTALTNTITNFKINVINIITIFKNEFIGIWKTLSNETLKVLTSFIQQAIKAVQDMVKAITDEVNKLPGVFSTAASNAMQSFTDGIRSQTKNAVDATNDLVQAVKEAFVKGLGIHSPSDITYWYGQMTGKGFIEGLSDSELAAFAKNYLNQIVDAFLEGKFSADDMVDFLGEDSLKVIHAIQEDPELMKKAMTAIPFGGGSASSIVAAALKYVGYQSGSSNWSIFNPRVGSGPNPWCAIFVKAMADEAGVYFPNMWSVPALADWAKSTGRWEMTPHVGDAAVIYGKYGPNSHIGIYAGQNPDGPRIIDGNTIANGGTWGVYDHTRNDITGYIHLDGSGAAPVQSVGSSDTIGYPLPFRVTPSSGFGGRSSPGGIGSTDHKGIDLPADTGTPILAALAGTVKNAGMSDGYGNLVTVTTGDLDILYGHMSRILTGAGQQVQKGQQIGLVGSTGWSTGPHLHFEMRRNGVAFDPSDQLNGASVSIGAGGGGYGRNLLDQIQDAYNRKYGITTSGTSSSYNPSAGVSQWTADVQRALTMLGQPLSYTDDILYVIQRESDGNPNPPDLHDSNWAAGIPSKGLMQTIPETFQTYRNPSLSNDILDPLANIYAGINYMIHTYGSIDNCVNPRRNSRRGWYGYAAGTRYVPQDMLAMIHEGEAILPASQNPYSQSGGDYLSDIAGRMVDSETNNYTEYMSASDTGATVISVGDINTTVHVSGSEASNPRDIGNAVADEIMNRLRAKMATKGGPKIEY